MRFVPPLRHLLIVAAAVRVAGLCAAIAVTFVGLRCMSSVPHGSVPHGRLMAAAALLMICAAAGVGVLFPTGAWPKPTGPHGVATTMLAAFSPETAQRAIEDAETRPKPRVQVWYPASTSTARSLLRQCGLRARQMVLGGGVSAALRDCPIASGPHRFPVLIYNSGWPGTGIDNYRLIEDLASHGYVVAALTYPDRAHLPAGEVAAQRGYLEQPVDYSSAAAYQDSRVRVTRRVRIRAADSIAVFDELGRLDASRDAAPFSGRLTTDRLGVFGFSLGGAVAAEASTLDSRVQAVVNMDGRHWGTALETGVSQAYLYIGERLVQPGDEELRSENCDRRHNAMLDRHDYSQLGANLRRNGGIQVVIEGTRHMNFTDGAVQSRLRRCVDTGIVDARRALEIQNAYIVQFFGQTLKVARPPILGPQVDTLPGSTVERWPRPDTRLGG